MVLPQNWAWALKSAWQHDTKLLQIPQYFPLTNQSGLWCAHTKEGFYWKYPVHELLIGEGKSDKVVHTLIIHEEKTSREKLQWYLQLAKQGVRENPNDPYCQLVVGIIQNKIGGKQWQ